MTPFSVNLPSNRKKMLRGFWLFNLSIVLLLNVSGQELILNREDILTEVKSGLRSIYNYQFDNARKSLEFIQKHAPDHPAGIFFESLIIYWENYPLTLDNPNTPRFLSLVEETYKKAEEMQIHDPDNPEGIFFDLFGRAFYVMFWSDIGKPGKVYPYLNLLYRQTVKGFELQKEFNEFSFTTGLYNYYIVKYPENHPAYRAVALLFRKGDKEYGITRLKFCSQNCVYLRVEANYYLSLINLKFENNYQKASEYASDLYREFPNNPLYTALYAEVLMLTGKYQIAEVLIRNLERSNNPYASMNGYILRGYYLEKYENQYTEAFIEYQKGLEMSKSFSDMSKYETARAYMGIARYHQRNKNNSESSKNFKAARNITSYGYILNDK